MNGLFRLPGDRWLGDKRCLISRTANWVFLLGAISVVALTPIFWGSLDPSKMSSEVRLGWGALCVFATPALLFLFLGMWRYWMRVDDSGPVAKRVWFVVLLFGFWWASLLYYFLVYLPQVIRKRKNES